MDAGASVITILDKLGITDYVMPFILIYFALYAITMKIKLPSDKPSLNGIISFAIAYLVIAFGLGPMINKLLPFFMLTALILMIGLLLFKFIGVPDQKIISFFSNPGTVTLLISLIVLFVFIGLQDWLIYTDRIPSWRVTSNGTVLSEVEVVNHTDTNISVKPHTIIVNGIDYELINGIYYKQGYEGAAYAIGSPEVVSSIFIILMIGFVAALIAWPKDT